MELEEGMAADSSSSRGNLLTSTTTPSDSTDDLQDCEPRPVRVPRPSRASDLTLTTRNSRTTSVCVPPSPSSPPLPARSPLRPPARSISSAASIRSEISRLSTISATGTPNTDDDDDNDAASPSSLPSSPISIALSDLDELGSPQTPADIDPIMLMNVMGDRDNQERHASFPSLSSLMDQVREEFGLEENEEDATLPLRVKPSAQPPLESLRSGSFTVSQSRESREREEVKGNSAGEMEGDGERYMEDGTKRDRDSSSSTVNSVASSSFGALLESARTSGAASTTSTPPSSVASHEPQHSDTPTATMITTKMSKRDHAMHELLSSERAYASDLALIREVHIPLALGQTIPLPNNIPPPPPPPPPSSTSTGSGPSSSSSSSRAVSTGSAESLDPTRPPMTQEDAKIIFSNISELALFSDMFTEELELALGDIVEGGQGDDYVGALFLRIIPDLERPYKMYITRHPTALQHLQALPQTPALQTYLAYTQNIASSVSHAWDLASLLIKPVQRLLKYPLLLNTIIDETPDGHPDKENLKSARTKIEEIARNVNEGRRRAEVVKDVLSSKTPKKPSAPVGVAASVNLSKVKSLRHGGVTAATMRVAALTEGSAGEAAQVEAMHAELKRIEVFAQQFAKNIVDWGKMMANMMLALRGWALSFGKVIGLSAEQRSEAFDAFLGVVTQGLLPLTVDLDSAINERLLKDMAHLLMTMSQPLKLLASMAEQEPYHYHLLTMPVSAKNRPPPALLEASTNYLALRGQLAAELPAYLGLLHKGCAVFVRRLAEIQTRFWRDVKERWAELWEMLRVEGELNAGYEETCTVWCARWADVDEVVQALNIARPVPPLVPVMAQAQAQARGYAALQAQYAQTLAKDQERERLAALGKRHDAYFSYPEFYLPMTPQLSLPKERDRDRLEKEQREKEKRDQKEREREQKEREKEQREREKLYERAAAKKQPVNVAAINSMFAALEPSHSPVHKKQSTAASVASTLASLNPPHALSSSGSGSSVYGGSSPPMYSVSGPMPLGSMASLSHRESTSKKNRGRGTSDASTTTQPRSSGSGSGAVPARRPSSQDSARQRFDNQSPPARRRTHGTGLSDDFEEYMKMSGAAMPSSYDGGHYTHSPPGGSRSNLNRRKSMPLSQHGGGSDQTSTVPSARTAGHGVQLPNGAGYVVDGDRLYYQTPMNEREEYQPYEETSPPRQKDTGRGRLSQPKSQTIPTQTISSPSKPKSKERTHARKRSGSTKSITSFFTGGSSDRNSNPSPPDPQPLTASQRDSWVTKPAKYICQVIHPCRPPTAVQYYSFPFFTLQVGEFYQVLQEAGHPSIHPKLPLYVDDGEDCLLLCRDGNGIVGWALASFLEPVSMEG
ncbi:hypothetical protein BDN70DRAFT_870597 [Pholiota conissans]|uniref:DH domain-containing protein n=1 Tax=Pholiota conissans TaxID=109636 RepID=A0A9P6CZ84_9AGAR|nr:hypothetical protein BDN70DRAFT_870597 [Pholiota conissans]